MWYIFVRRRKRLLWLASMAAEALCAGEQQGNVDLRRWLSSSMEALGSGATLPTILNATFETDP